MNSKGEENQLVMHKYRPTLKDLDGTLPGQSPFVLMRNKDKRSGNDEFERDDNNVHLEEIARLEENGHSEGSEPLGSSWSLVSI
ncbi:hypothetical protein Patl1_34414 [Pistacia atlantica]|uniref:Uncharacterized protein n=1 Tax=Pistacia atlantica TaxID=434234 RepID=A0ACC0ZT59_9ROSI|nr:hypothetical protein Patl1_34414 [Pistacia atlantica]